MNEESGALVRDGFICPICRFDAYCRVVVFRSDHSRYLTPFYRCGGCSVMFINRQIFSADEKAVRLRPSVRGEPPR